MGSPSQKQREMDRLKITLTFGVLSFESALLLFLLQNGGIPRLEMVFGGFVKIIIATSIFLLFLYILCTAAFYRSEKIGILDFLKVNRKKKEWLFDAAIEWSFVASTVVMVSYILGILTRTVGITKCGQALWERALCLVEFMLVLLVAFLILRLFFRTLRS